jgi:hypothetical protein
VRQPLGEGASISRAKNAAVKFALSMSGRPHFDNGGIVHGAINSIHGGRTDTLPVSVPSGSYVLPADIVSGLPGAEGNTLAGHTMLNKLFASQPFSPDKAPWGVKNVDLPRGHTMPGRHDRFGMMLPNTPMERIPHANGGLVGADMHNVVIGPWGSGLPRRGMANGGPMGDADGSKVDIMAAGGEYIVHPDIVRKLGHGNLRLGHEILDELVKRVRESNIKTLKNLPGPVKKG